MGSIIRSLIGWFLIAFAAFFLLGFLVSTPKTLLDIPFLLLLVGTPAAGGTKLIMSSRRLKRLASSEKCAIEGKAENKNGLTREEMSRYQAHVVRLAKHKGRGLSVLEIVSETGHSMENVEMAMQQLVKQGYVHMNINENGVIIYEFPGLMPTNPEPDENLWK